MEHMGLFEGIGGFSLAARWAGWQTPVMVEWNPYCQMVLKKNFPDATIFGDIKQFDGRPYAGQIDIITGGFPCQPFSHAGKRAGTNDDRYLWPEMLRVIQEVGPAWVVGENVAGILSMDGGRVLRGILADLENAGYSPEIFVIPAVGVGAPHRRDRVWIVANAYGINDLKPHGRGESTANRIPKVYWAENGSSGESCRTNIGVVADAERQQSRKRHKPSMLRRWPFEAKQTWMGHWSEHWYEVATRICRVDDGISTGLDGTGNLSAKTQKGKAHRLEALGNAIVPQVAYEIFNAINNF